MTESTSTRPYLLVGEAPNRATENSPRHWLLPDDSGIPHSANRLLDLSGMTIPDFLVRFDRTNLLYRWPGSDPRARAGDLWDPRAASESVNERRAEWAGRKVILLGRRVARAFGLGDLPWFRWIATPVTTAEPDAGYPEAAAVVPHPSGANRMLNDPEVRDAFRDFFDRLS